MQKDIHPVAHIIRPRLEYTRDIDFRRMVRELEGKYAKQQVVTDLDLQMIGRYLWGMPEVNKSFDEAVETAGRSILPVIIQSDDPEVQALPWETLYHPVYGFIGHHPGFTLTRQIVSEVTKLKKREKGPLRILLFTSLPDDVNTQAGRLNVEEEQEKVREALINSLSSGLVELEMPDDGRFSTFKELLEKFSPHVVFLSGHGKYNYEPHTGEMPFGEFLFESESGLGDLVRDIDIARALSVSNVKAVILSACESGKASSVSLTGGLMQQVGLHGVEQVIGMRESIFDVSGIQFARELCDGIVSGDRLDVALQKARGAIIRPLKNDDRSMGQWCLPMMFSVDLSEPLIDWDFSPPPALKRWNSYLLHKVEIPERYIGRRKELRKYKNDLRDGKVTQLLITGAGGQGKTALAGKIALDLEFSGVKIFVWRAQTGDWHNFMMEIMQDLSGDRLERYNNITHEIVTKSNRIDALIGLLLEQYDHNILFFLDHVEVIQDAASLELSDELVQDFLECLKKNPKIRCIVTSRQKISNWTGSHFPLLPINYGDFIQIAALKKATFDRDQMQDIYGKLGGNIRGLDFLIAQAHHMGLEPSGTFVLALEHAKDQLEIDMMIQGLYEKLPVEEKILLSRFLAYQAPVPVDGLFKLAQDMLFPEKKIEHLSAISFLEIAYNPQWSVEEYQVNSMVQDWLKQNGLIDNAKEWLGVAAMYQMYLFEQERKTLLQAGVVSQSLYRADLTLDADKFTLMYLVGNYMQIGLYRELVDNVLPRILISDDQSVRGEALSRMGEAKQNCGEADLALSFSKQALDIFNQMNDHEYKAVVLNNIGKIHHESGLLDDALTFYFQSLDAYQRRYDKQGEAVSLNNISQIYALMGETIKALDYLKRSLSVSRECGEQSIEVKALINLGYHYQAEGEKVMSLNYYRQAETIANDLGADPEVAIMYNNISQLYYTQGDIHLSNQYLSKALELTNKMGKLKNKAEILSNISQNYSLQGDNEKALSFLGRSLDIFRKAGYQFNECITLNNISRIHHNMGNYKLAEQTLNEAISLASRINYKENYAEMLSNLSELYYIKGEYTHALTFLEQALTFSQKINNQKGIAIVFENMGKNYLALGNLDKALICFEKGLLVFEKTDNKLGISQSLNSISQIHQRNQKYDLALKYLHQSLNIVREVGYLAGIGAVLLNIGQILSNQGIYEKALPYLEESLNIFMQINDKANLCMAFFNMGSFYYTTRNFNSAKEYWVSAYKIAKEIEYAEVLNSLVNSISPLIGIKHGLDEWEFLAAGSTG